MNTNLKRAGKHLWRAFTRKSMHAIGGILVVLVQFLQWCKVLLFLNDNDNNNNTTNTNTPILASRGTDTTHVLDTALLLLTIPYAVGLFMPAIRRRHKYSRRKWSAYTGMSWVCAFHTLACSSYAQPSFVPRSQGLVPSFGDGDFTIQLCTRLFYVFLATSVMCTALEIAQGTPRGNGWAFGVVFSYLTLLFPIGLERYLKENEHHQQQQESTSMQDFYETWNIGPTIQYNTIQTSLLTSISFFIISMQDSKIVSEEFADRVGRMLWTFPYVPLTYLSIVWINSKNLEEGWCWTVANFWLLVTSVIAGVIMVAQKNGYLISTLLKPANETKTVAIQQPASEIRKSGSVEDARFLGIFKRGLVWDDEHVAFFSLDPSPQYAWGILVGYWGLGALAAIPYDYYGKLQRSSPVLFDQEARQDSLTVVVILISIGMTIVAQLSYYRNTNTGGRPFNLFAALVLALANGVFETFLFCYFFDLGVDAARYMGFWENSQLWEFTVGFHVFSLVSALVHAVMWGAHVLPANYDSPRGGGDGGGVRTRKASEDLLFWNVIPMSFCWYVVYFFFQDLWTVLLCHIYADIWIAKSVHFPAPSWAHPPNHPRSHTLE